MHVPVQPVTAYERNDPIGLHASTGVGAELDRIEFPDELFRARVTACQVTVDELMEEVDRVVEANCQRVASDLAFTSLATDMPERPPGLSSGRVSWADSSGPTSDGRERKMPYHPSGGEDKPGDVEALQTTGTRQVQAGYRLT